MRLPSPLRCLARCGGLRRRHGGWRRRHRCRRRRGLVMALPVPMLPESVQDQTLSMLFICGIDRVMVTCAHYGYTGLERALRQQKATCTRCQKPGHTIRLLYGRFLPTDFFENVRCIMSDGNAANVVSHPSDGACIVFFGHKSAWW